MEPEKGDPRLRVTRQDVCAGFCAAGTRPGDLLFFHGSLSSMGRVEGGAPTVIDGALDAVAPGGTVGMPSLWYHDADPPLDPADFDVETSPSYVGALSEALRRDPRSRRSHHFSHSVNAIGPRAAELTADHGAAGLRPTPWGPRAFADSSPWERLYRWNALYAFIGVTMRVCTMKHYIECRIVCESLDRAPVERRGALERELRGIGREGGLWPFYNSEAMENNLAERGLMAYAKIGSATVRAIRTRALVETTREILHREPERWFSAEFLAWQGRAAE